MAAIDEIKLIDLLCERDVQNLKDLQDALQAAVDLHNISTKISIGSEITAAKAKFYEAAKKAGLPVI